MSKIIAQLNFLHLAPRKVRAVAKTIIGMDVNRARFQLSHLIRRPRNPLTNLLKSAIANAKNNFSMVEDNLFIKNIIVNEGIKLKRFKPKGFGRAAPIQKKTSHVKIVLGEKTPGLRIAKTEKPKENQEKKMEQPETKSRKTAEKEKPEIKKEIGEKESFGRVKNISRKLFRRKSI